MRGALARFHDPRGLHHRVAEVLEPSEAIPFTGDAGEDPHARAAVPGQAEAVITSRTGLCTPALCLEACTRHAGWLGECLTAAAPKAAGR